MKRILTGLIGGVALAGLAFGTAAASGDDDYYEHGERYEHGRAYYNPTGAVVYGYGVPNGYASYGNGNVYRGNHELYEHGRARVNTYVPPRYNNYNSGYNSGYSNHERYEYHR